MPETNQRSRREERRRVHQELSRAQILDAAEDVFSRKGFHETTLKEVAELAEFSVGSVYSFFENKDDLYAQIFLRRADEFLPGMRAIADIDDDALTLLHRLADHQIGFFRDHPSFGRLFLRSWGIASLSLATDVHEVIQANFKEAMELQANVFRRGQEAGRMRDGDPHVLSHLFSGVIAAYQATDPAVIDGAGETTELLPLGELHDLLEGAFRIRSTGTP